MNENDPFSAYEADRTIVKPSAGRGAAARSPAAMPAAAPAQTFDDPQAQEVIAASSSGLNPLLQAATPLLLAGAAIRVMPRHVNPELLRESLVETMKRFESEARRKGLSNEE